MKKIIFGAIVAVCFSATPANAGSIYDGIWLDSTTGEIATFVTKGTGAVGDQMVAIDMGSSTLSYGN